MGFFLWGMQKVCQGGVTGDRGWGITLGVKGVEPKESPLPFQGQGDRGSD
jgi:hypothetical protein